MSDSGGIHFTVEGYTADQVEEFIDKEVRRQVRSAVEEKVTERIDPVLKEKLDNVADELVRERISNELDLCLEEGWRETSKWGKSCGDKITLKDRLSDMIGEGQGSNSAAYKMLQAAINQEVVPVLKKEARRLAAEIKGRVDALVKTSLADVVRDAVGLEKK